MKKILNEWKKFIMRESKKLGTYHAPKIPITDCDGINRLLYFGDEGNYNLVLYRINPEGSATKDFYILGAATIQKTAKPCINSLEVSTIYIEPAMMKQGLGLLLYQMCFQVARNEGYGLTSDHTVGTRPKAAGTWKKIESLSDIYGKNVYKVKKTPAGNDKFDYDGSTPDADDDCDKGRKNKPATDRSFYIKKSHKTVFNRLVKNHEKLEKIKKYEKFFSRAGIDFEEFEDDYLFPESSGRFKEVYDAQLNEDNHEDE